jgi:hypothetical protein
VVLQIFVDGVEQKALARQLDVDAGTVTRIKQKAIERIRQYFLHLASDVAGLPEETVQYCLNLLLDCFSDSLLDPAIARHTGSARNFRADGDLADE